MEECYLCGEKLIDTPSDYLQNKEKYKGLAVKHDEHIIQNALYGRLTSDNILCEICGGKLSTIDSDFCKIFESLTERIKHLLASKDHGNNDFKRTLKGYIYKKDGTQIPVHIKEGKVTPEKPYYEFIETKNRVEIYSTKAIGKEIKNKAIKELTASGINTSLIEFVVIDDISNAGSLGVNFLEVISNVNEKFQLGLNKIATGFALSHGINRNNAPRTLDTKNKKLKLSDNIIPFRTLAPFDILIEPFRSLMEDDYPTHTLILYTDNFAGQQVLVCYIDLFSTFQYYVILNDNYSGPQINKSYYQTILRQTKPEINVRNVRMKHLLIVADEIGVKPEELKDKKIDEIYDILEKRYKQFTVSYQKNIKDYLHKVSSNASLKLALRKGNLSKHLNEEEKEIVEALPDFDHRHLLCIYKELQRIEEDNELNYRRKFIGAKKDGALLMLSTIHSMMNLFRIAPETFEAYGHQKFFQLSQFIQNNEKK